jgi:hypothetical protein
MSSALDQPLNFTGESFERFQALLKDRSSPESWVWLLRDGIFGTITHDPLSFRRIIRSKEALLILPGGWMLWLLIHKLQAMLGRIPAPPPPAHASYHLLFLSTRSNHIKRVLPLLRDFNQTALCLGWANQSKILQLIDEDLKPQMRLTSNSWAFHLHLADLRAAASCAKDLGKSLGSLHIPWLQRGKVRIYIALFLAWRRFWEQQFKSRPQLVLTTYEKDPMAKAMLHVAKQIGVPERIHWAHGLRHASLQSTFASELWCLIEPDVPYYRRLLPADCTPVFKQSPESIELIQDIGILDENDLKELKVVNFLFLGNGFDSAYPAEASQADLSVIRTAMRELGAQVNWRFRPHPGNIPRFKEDLSALGLEQVDISTNSLRDDLQWAHAAGSPFSSVLVDMKQAGRKVFWVQETIRPLYGVDELIREGYGTHVDTKTVTSRIREAFDLPTLDCNS